jgi:sec-independent protein translocase protein TatA
MGELSAWHWAVVVLVAVLLFGSQRLPDLARGVGRSARILRAELRADAHEPTDPPDPEAR